MDTGVTGRRDVLVLLVALLVLCNLVFFTPLAKADTIMLNTQYSMRLHTQTQIMRHNLTIDSFGVSTIQFSTAEAVGDTQSYWNIRLIDSKLSVICELIVFGDTTTVESERLRLPLGSYDLRITAGENYSNTDFELTVTFASEADILVEREPNDTLQNANIAEINRAILGNTQNKADIDIFMLQVEEDGYLVVQLQGDRFSSGQYWQLQLKRDGEDAIPLALDAKLNQSNEVLVRTGNYWLIVSAHAENWSDLDYRLTPRFTPLGDREPQLLTIGVYTQGVIHADKEEAEFRFSYAATEESMFNSLALRVHNEFSADETFYAVLYDALHREIWHGATVSAHGIYAEILTDILPGDYLLTIRATESTISGVPFEIGLFYPEELPLKLELAIGDTEFRANGETMPIDPGFDTAPMIINDRTVLPIRSIVDLFGGTIDWEAEERRVSLYCNGHAVLLWIGDSTAIVDGNPKDIGTAPVAIGGRTMLPLRFVSEALGCHVHWIAEGEQIIIRN